MANLNDSQIYDIIKQYVEIKVDRMDTQELVEHVTENLKDWYSDFSLEELESVISGDDEELLDELIDNVTNEDDDEELTTQEQVDYINSNLTEETFIDINNTGGKF